MATKTSMKKAKKSVGRPKAVDKTKKVGTAKKVGRPKKVSSAKKVSTPKAVAKPKVAAKPKKAGRPKKVVATATPKAVAKPKVAAKPKKAGRPKKAAATATTTVTQRGRKPATAKMPAAAIPQGQLSPAQKTVANIEKKLGTSLDKVAKIQKQIKDLSQHIKSKVSEQEVVKSKASSAKATAVTLRNERKLRGELLKSRKKMVTLKKLLATAKGSSRALKLDLALQKRVAAVDARIQKRELADVAKVDAELEKDVAKFMVKQRSVLKKKFAARMKKFVATCRKRQKAIITKHEKALLKADLKTKQPKS